jgi:hypothetical protein
MFHVTFTMTHENIITVTSKINVKTYISVFNFLNIARHALVFTEAGINYSKPTFSAFIFVFHWNWVIT